MGVTVALVLPRLRLHCGSWPLLAAALVHPFLSIAPWSLWRPPFLWVLTETRVQPAWGQFYTALSAWLQGDSTARISGLGLGRHQRPEQTAGVGYGFWEGHKARSGWGRETMRSLCSPFCLLAEGRVPAASPGWGVSSAGSPQAEHLGSELWGGFREDAVGSMCLRGRVCV